MVDQGRNQYPAPLAKYEDVVSNRQLFMTTLESLHAAMATKFMIPVIGGRDLDLHKLFVEVTSRGGIEKILSEKRWKEVTATFTFPTTATNASFVLRKYYYSLLLHYERIYYFKALDYSPAVLQSLNPAPAAVHGLSKLSAPAHPTNVHQNQINTTESLSQAPSGGYPIIGVIDGKFESGYLVTVTVGKDKLKGVLYQTPTSKVEQVSQTSGVSTGKTDNTHATSGVPRRRRRRRRKSEIRKRDPTHPKPNRSGYNFFFSEKHAILKPLHPGKDREISRMIGELWNNLKDSGKAVYQEKAVKDKERYRTEMEDYKERLRTNQVISAIPIQQRLPDLDAEMEEIDVKDERERDSQGSPENESDSGKSETEEEDEDEEEEEEEEEEDEDEIMEEDGDISDAETSPVVGDTSVESGNAGTCCETTTAAAAAAGEFPVVEGVKKAGCEESEGSLGGGSHLHGEMKKQDSPPKVEHEKSIITPAVT